MNEIKITLSVKELSELTKSITNLVDAISNNSTHSHDREVTDSKPTADEAPMPNESQSSDSQSTSIGVSSGTCETVTPTPPAVTYTIDQISNAGAELCEQGKMSQLIELLGKYGVQAVTQLADKPELLNQLGADLKAIGAAL